MAIDVLLDTSVLRKEHFGTLFNKLQQLVDQGVIQVHLPSVVLEEWASQMQTSFHQKLKKASSSLEALKRDPMAKLLERHDDFARLEEALQEISIERNRAEIVSVLRTLLSADMVEVGEGHGCEVLAMYFDGKLPFAKPKSRNDFPDAFIYLVVRDLLDGHPNTLHVVVGDERLREALAELDDVRAHEEMREFLQHPAVIAATPEDLWRQIYGKVVKYLRTNPTEIIKQIKDPADLIAGKFIQHPSIPGDGQAYISGPYALENPVFGWDQTEDLNRGTLYVPISFDCEAEIEFAVHRDEAYGADYAGWWYQPRHIDDHYCDAGGTVTLTGQAWVVIQVDYDWMEEEDLEDVSAAIKSMTIDAHLEDLERLTIHEQRYGVIFQGAAALEE